MKKFRIWLSPPHMGGEELEIVNDVFDSNWVAPAGPHLEEFESELCGITGAKHCVALSAGTSAIHLALITEQIGPDHDVFCQSFTFGGSAFPIVYLGANPVFIDSEPDTWNMDPQLLEDAINATVKKGRKPGAVIMVHLYGMPADIEGINSVAARYGLPVIEDAAEALGSEYNGQGVGNFGKYGILSFNGNKIITTSGGGALLTDDENIAGKVRSLSTQSRLPLPHYEHAELGYNYRLSNVLAGIGIGQLRSLESRVKRKREIFDYYEKELGSSAIKFQPEPSGMRSNRWLTCMVVEDNSGVTPEDLRQALYDADIEARPLWKPMHLQPVFKDADSFTNGISESLFSSGLCLPSGTALTDSELDEIIAILKEKLLIR